MLSKHNDYPKLKRELMSDSLRSLAGIDIDSVLVRLQFEDPVWDGTYPLPDPVSAHVRINLDGGTSFDVTYDWVKQSVSMELI